MHANVTACFKPAKDEKDEKTLFIPLFPNAPESVACTKGSIRRPLVVLISIVFS